MQEWLNNRIVILKKLKLLKSVKFVNNLFIVDKSEK